MFSKLVSKPFTSSLGKVGFSSLKKVTTDLFGSTQDQIPHIKIATFDPKTPFSVPNAIIKPSVVQKSEVSVLPNGVTVFTQAGVFPNKTNLGILLKLGTRDETEKTSGSLAVLKDNYHDTLLHTPSANPYLIENCGGQLDMQYNQEVTYFQTDCFAHHMNTMFESMLEAALKPISTNVAIHALQALREKLTMIEMQMQGMEEEEDLGDILHQTAFAKRGLGMPEQGFKENLKTMTPEVIQQFQRTFIHPENILIAASGIDNHRDFAQYVESRLHFLPTSKAPKRETTEYVGGEYRKDTGGEDVSVTVAFKSVPWRSDDVFALQVLKTLVGSSASFSTGGPGKGMHSRATKHLLNKVHCVNAVDNINENFTDTGLFGLSLEGEAGDANELLKVLIHEFKLLAQPIPAQELQRAKNITKSNLLTDTERMAAQLEEGAKSIFTFGHVHTAYDKYVDEVTSEQINLAVKKMFQSPPTFVARGGGVSALPDYAKIRRMLVL